MLSHRWFIASGFITLLLSGCGGAKSSQEIAKLTQASVILITAYTEQPSTGTGFFIEGEKGVCTVLTARHVVPIGTKVQLQSNDGKHPWEAVNIQRFPNQDLALVTFKPKGENCPYPALELGDSDKVAEGETYLHYGVSWWFLNAPAQPPGVQNPWLTAQVHLSGLQSFVPSAFSPLERTLAIRQGF